MNLGAEREYVAEVLNGLNLGPAYTYIPERPSLPAWWITPADPYITGGQTFATAVAHFEVAYISTFGANSNNSRACDDAISAAATAFVGQGVSVEGGSAPFAVTVNQAQYVSQNLTISFQINL